MEGGARLDLGAVVVESAVEDLAKVKSRLSQNGDSSLI